MEKTHVEIIPQPSFLQEVEKASGQKVSACFQCHKCSSGCPSALAMDYPPHRLIRLIHLGLKEEVLKSSTPWVCASCETCTTRCPNNIDIAHLMDTVKQMAIKAKAPMGQREIFLFHSAFLDSVRRYGRAFELGLIGEYKRKSGQLFTDLPLGLKMFKKGKMRLVPSRVKAKKAIKRLFQEANKR